MRTISLLAVIVTPMIAVSAGLGAGAAIPATAGPIPDASPMEIGGCNACIGCGGGAHILAELQPPYYNFFVDSHDCESGHTCESHEQCPLPEATPEELGRLWVALSTLQGEDLREAAGTYDFVSYDPERRAFQFRACGAVVGHLPLSDAQAESFAVAGLRFP